MNKKIDMKSVDLTKFLIPLALVNENKKKDFKNTKSKRSTLLKDSSIKNTINKKTNTNKVKEDVQELNEDKLLKKQLLEKFIKLNSELPFQKQKTATSGNEVKQRALIKKSKRKIQKLRPPSSL